MQQPIQNGCCQHRVADHLAPIHKALVADDNQAAAFVTARQQPEEQTGIIVTAAEQVVPVRTFWVHQGYELVLGEDGKWDEHVVKRWR